MAKHQNLSSPFAVHPFAFSSNADPANDGSIDMAPYKGWINTGSSNTLKVRNAANTAWEDVSVAGATTTPAFGSNSNSVAVANAPGASTLASRADHVHLGVRSIAHTSNTFSGPITLTASGGLGITSPSSGTFNLSAPTSSGGSGGGAATDLQSGKVTRTSGDITTTSTSFVDLTGASITITTGARRVLLTFNSAWFLSTASTMAADFMVDGARVGGDFGLAIWNVNHANQAAPIHMSFLTDVLSAGSHTFKVQWKVTSGTGTMYGSTANQPYHFAAVELYLA